jgi:hypothetical protein
MQNAYENLVCAVKAYKGRLSRENKDIIDILRLYPIIEPKKFDYGEDTIIKILNDSLARVANSFYPVGSKDLTKVLAVFLETSKISSESNVTKYILEKIYFSQKGSALQYNQKIEKIINFKKCDQFISENNKLLLLDYILEIREDCDLSDNTINAILRKDNDIDILKNLFIDLKLVSSHKQLNQNIYQKLYYLIILFFDYMMLCDIFPNYFEIKMILKFMIL